jgi:hypothetical protein
MSMSRRDFLLSSTATFGALIAPGALLRARPARALGSDPVLVALYLRGGADALNLVVPHGDPSYYAARQRTRVTAGSRDRSRRVLWSPSLARPAPSLVQRGPFRRDPRLRQPERHPLALRCDGLHGVRGPRRQVRPGRLAQPVHRRRRVRRADLRHQPVVGDREGSGGPVGESGAPLAHADDHARDLRSRAARRDPRDLSDDRRRPARGDGRERDGPARAGRDGGPDDDRDVPELGARRRARRTSPR